MLLPDTAIKAFKPKGNPDKEFDGGGLYLERALTAHSQSQRQLQERISRNSADLQSLTRRLEGLAELYNSLEPLLSRLSGILNGKESGSEKGHGAGSRDWECKFCLSICYHISFRLWLSSHRQRTS